MHEKVYVACPGATAQAAGTCNYCGIGIRYCYIIEAADGKRFEVGCDCVRKIEREDNRLFSEVEKIERTFKREQNRKRREKRMEPETKRIAAAVAMIESKRESLASKPHPVIKGSTLLDYVEFLRYKAGHSGQLRMARIIENA